MEEPRQPSPYAAVHNRRRGLCQPRKGDHYPMTRLSDDPGQTPTPDRPEAPVNPQPAATRNETSEAVASPSGEEDRFPECHWLFRKGNKASVGNKNAAKKRFGADQPRRSAPAPRRGRPRPRCDGPTSPRPTSPRRRCAGPPCTWPASASRSSARRVPPGLERCAAPWVTLIWATRARRTTAG